ncbi:MAG: nucleotidyltransferase domain-containing protein [Actinobacteria bacterium]|nr:nucleotidyltransferase domain-containing protein [Actinomycetota bacterium]
MSNRSFGQSRQSLDAGVPVPPSPPRASWWWSGARGDFNKWSDLDVLVVAEDLPDTLAARLALVAKRPPGLEVILWTPGEEAQRRSRGTDPAATEAYEVGVVVYGELPG